jgi:hypothetical protein
MTSMELERWITSHPQGSTPEAQKVLKPQKFDEKAYDRERKAEQRAKGREIYIPVPKNIKLRNECLADPELLLTTYFREFYYEPFTADRRDMLQSIWRAAMYGGDQAIAASRGEGKTTLAMDGAFCLMLAGLTFFPVVISKNQDSASEELKALRERIMSSETFVEDFPEIGIPLQAVGASTANARLQTVGGEYIRMHLGEKFFAFPKITKNQLHHWPSEVEPVSNGQIIGAVGIYGKIRGCKFRAKRPTVALIDDVEDKDSGRNDVQIEKIEQIIEEDIGGMGASAERIARVYLCTTLNRKCNAFKFTDREQKPSWRGKRYRKMIKPPERMDLIEQYIELRKKRDDDDPDARVAFRFWRDSKDSIEAGCIVSNPHSRSKKMHADGEPLELSAIQSYYNRVADFGAKAVSTEIDNDPPAIEEIQTINLTHAHVASSKSGMRQSIRPEWADKVVRGVDMGKTDCWWVDIAFALNGTGAVIDYGKFHPYGLSAGSSNAAIELALLNALVNFANQDTPYEIDYALVDAGYKTDAIYEGCRRLDGNYFPVRGLDGSYRQPKLKDDGSIKLFHECHCILVKDRDGRDVWLFHPNVEYWKNWLQERWMCDPWTGGTRTPGSMALFDPPNDDIRYHSPFAKSQVSERLEHVPLPGKAFKAVWNVVDRSNNHWLDAAGYACAAGSCLGVRLVEEVKQIPIERKQPKPFLDPWGRPFVARR